ncbi:MAG TPA: YbaK/EbsC family protein [Eoetvoesiella sp.]
MKILDANAILALSSHPTGSVCPFGLATNLPVYCDISLQDFDVVMPAAKSINSAVRITPQRMAELINAVWVDASQAVPKPLAAL